MSDERLQEYLYQMLIASQEACGFVASMDYQDFISDTRTQKAVAMNLLLIGQGASSIIKKFPTFIAHHPEIAWQGIRGLRNRIAHDYMNLNLEVMWQTVLDELPLLQQQIRATPEGAG